MAVCVPLDTQYLSVYTKQISVISTYELWRCTTVVWAAFTTFTHERKEGLFVWAEACARDATSYLDVVAAGIPRPPTKAPRCLNYYR